VVKGEAITALNSYVGSVVVVLPFESPIGEFFIEFDTNPAAA
jgi:hypothetical protein